jgi:hypothetical protein
LASDAEIDVYRLAVEHQQHEEDLYWTRNTAFLLVQGVLLGLYGASGAPSVTFKLVPAVAGLGLAAIWYLVLRRGKVYVARWEAVVHELEAKSLLSMSSTGGPTLDLLAAFHRAQAAERTPRLSILRAETSQLMKLATVFTAVLWVAAGVLAFVAPKANSSGRGRHMHSIIININLHSERDSR